VPPSVSDRFVLGVPLGRWQTNCFVVGDRSLGTAVVVDPGEGAEDAVPQLLRQAGVTCEAIALTHGHLDHLWGVPSLARDLDVPVLLHPDDRWIWDDPAAAFGAPPELLEQQFGLRWDPPTERLRDVADGEDVQLAGVTYRVDHNPGHTPGHVTYLGRDLGAVPVSFALGDADVATDQLLFSGDLIFAGSVGRSDFPRGDGDRLLRSLVDTVLPLGDDTLILSGHGPDTTVGRERATNPFLAEAVARHG
jgi:hydroxyacylglutathione hydrolase